MGGASPLSASLSFQLEQGSPRSAPLFQAGSSVPSQPEALRPSPPTPAVPASAAPTETPQGQLSSADPAGGAPLVEGTVLLTASEAADASASEAAADPDPDPTSDPAPDPTSHPAPDLASFCPPQSAAALPLSCPTGSSLASPTSHLEDHMSERDADVSPTGDADAVATCGDGSPPSKVGLTAAKEWDHQTVEGAGESRAQCGPEATVSGGEAGSRSDAPALVVKMPCLEIAGGDVGAGHEALGGAGLAGGPSTIQAATSTPLLKWPAPGSFRTAADAAGLSLYGRGDHDSSALISSDLGSSSADRIWGLSTRAAFLLLVFSPFIALGIPLLLLSTWAAASTPASSSRRCSGEEADVDRSKKGRQGEATAVALRKTAWWTLLLGCRMAGAATIKVGKLESGGEFAPRVKGTKVWAVFLPSSSACLTVHHGHLVYPQWVSLQLVLALLRPSPVPLHPYAVGAVGLDPRGPLPPGLL